MILSYSMCELHSIRLSLILFLLLYCIIPARLSSSWEVMYQTRCVIFPCTDVKHISSCPLDRYYLHYCLVVKIVVSCVNMNAGRLWNILLLYCVVRASMSLKWVSCVVYHHIVPNCLESYSPMPAFSYDLFYRCIFHTDGYTFCGDTCLILNTFDNGFLWVGRCCPRGCHLGGVCVVSVFPEYLPVFLYQDYHE